MLYFYAVAARAGPSFKPGGPLLRWYTGQVAVLRYRDFRFLMGATFFNSFSYWVEQVALGWLVLSLTDSVLMVGIAYAARMVPFFFLGIPAGAVADRVNRRLFLRTLTAGIGVTWFLIAALIMTGKVEAWHLIGLALVAGCMRAFFATTYSALLYDIVGVRGAVTGMAWSSVVSHGAGILGAVLAGIITATVGGGGAYLAAGASFGASLVLVMFMRESGQAAPINRESVGQNLRGALRLVRTNRVLLGLSILTAASEAFGYSSSVILPTFARDVLHVGPQGLGLMVAVRSGAGILGPLALSMLTSPRGLGRLLLFTTLLFGASIVALGFVPNLLMALVVLSVLNAAGSAVDVLTKTLMQANVPNEERGRAMGAWVMAIGIGPAGQVQIGAVAAALSVALALTVNGAATLVIAVAVFAAMPRLRRL